MPKESGFSLLEVLIALSVLSVGMLGVASLYVQGMRAGQTSIWRDHAVTLAGDVAERIRANPHATSAYRGDALDNHCVARVRNCNEVEMAGHDILLWQQQAVETLPAGGVEITVDDAVHPAVYTIDISWIEPAATQRSSYSIKISVRSI